MYRRARGSRLRCRSPRPARRSRRPLPRGPEVPPMMNDARRITAVIADDEPRLAQYLRERLAALWPELVVAGIAANGPEAKALIDAEAPDVAFLDIRMPGMTGLEVAQ